METLMVKKYDVNDLPTILEEMAEYVKQCKANGEYDTLIEYFCDITDSNLFHDAIGKIIQNDISKVLVTEDY